jgi:hypothetical protein
MKTNHQKKSKESITMETHNFSPDVHVLASTLRSRCVDHHFVVRRLIGNPKSSSPRAPQQPTASEVTQWHEQFTRVVFGASPGKTQHPSQITGRWPRTSTTLATTPSLPPNALRSINLCHPRVAHVRHQMPDLNGHLPCAKGQERPDAQVQRTWHTASVRSLTHTHSRSLTGRAARSMHRTLQELRPVVSSKSPESKISDWTRQVEGDRTHLSV